MRYPDLDIRDIFRYLPIIIVFAVPCLYLLFNILVKLALAFIFLSLIGIGIGIIGNNEQIIITSSIGFALGIIFMVIGNSGIGFFECNPIGKNLLNTANVIVNSTREIAQSKQLL